jgi:sterol desaturase/sphingolipid hydroxylase (fatty acid hydroxylase superfamily)
MNSIWAFPTKSSDHPNSCRMFERDLVERFSRIHPATPFVAWLPFVAYMLYRSVSRHDLPLAVVPLLFLVGVLAWTLAEYMLHRFVFHWISDTPAGRRIHFLVHGVHHDFPGDKDRLVMPLGFSIPLAVVFYATFYAMLGRAVAEPYFAGFVFGYLMYDGSHYAIHHFRMQSKISSFLKKHHMRHHHADHDGGFGVSSPLWDLVFRTMPEPKKRMGGSTMAHNFRPEA